jgi:hypothetical protein
MFVTLLILLGGSLFIYVWATSGRFGACVEGTAGDLFRSVVGELDNTIDLTVKLSTTLAGVGAALLVGLKGGVKLTGPIRALLLISSCAFAESVFYAIKWRWGVADAWLNDCLNLLSEPSLQRLFDAHVLAFLIGVLALALLTITAALGASGGDAQ